MDNFLFQYGVLLSLSPFVPQATPSCLLSPMSNSPRPALWFLSLTIRIQSSIFFLLAHIVLLKNKIQSTKLEDLIAVIKRFTNQAASHLARAGELR